MERDIMTRLTPDSNDILVWLLDETSGAFRNSGSLLPNDAATDLVVTNTLSRGYNGIFADCVNIPGTSNFPSGSSATRNYAAGAKTINPALPITVSCWVKIRTYNTSFNAQLIAKEFRDSGITSSWATPFLSFAINTTTGNGGGDWNIHFATSTSTFSSFNVTDFPIPIGQWSHIGFTMDGSNVRAYLNGCQCIYYTGSVQSNTVAATGVFYTDGINGNGFWRIGAITATGSANKEEPNILIQDVRVANVARPLSYFQNIYNFGRQPSFVTTATRYYKLRAFDTSCVTPTPVVWVDTEISLVNAPSFPCSGPYSDPEVLDTWIE